MHAVAIELHREVGAIIHDEGDTALLADRPQRIGGPDDRLVGDVLQPQLEGRDVAAVEGGAKVVGKDRRMLDAGGRDQIETGHGLPDFRVVYAEPGVPSRAGLGESSHCPGASAWANWRQPSRQEP